MTSISHRPGGSGHPYATSADQRVPVQPLADRPVWLGVVASNDIDEVWCEVCDNTGAPRRLAASRRDDASASGVGLDGHLAQAQAAAGDVDGVAWQVELDGAPLGQLCRYRFVAKQACTSWYEFRSAAWGRFDDGLVDVATRGYVKARPRDIEWLSDGERAYRVRFWLPLAPSEHVVGFGERYDAIDQRGLTPDVVVFEQYKQQGKAHRTYFPMPFAHVVGDVGWGFHVATSRRVWFDVAATSPNRLCVEAEVGEDAHLRLDLYGGDPEVVLRAFLDGVGRAQALPSWVHRLWASGNEWNTQALVMKQMDAHRAHETPVGVVVIEAWSDEEGITIFRDAQYDVHVDGSPHGAGDFTYAKDGAWPDPAGMIAELHRRGIKVILWQIPLLKTAGTFAAEHQVHGQQVILDGQSMITANQVVTEVNGAPYHNRGWWFPYALMPDLSTQGGRDAWAARRRYLVADLDVDGFKTDGGEHAWGADLRYNDGSSGDESNNLNPVRYAKTFGDLLRAHGKAPVTFSRAGFTGSQAHGVFWAGDEDSTWEAFECSIRAGVTAGACGVVYWGWDMAGFSGPLPTPELYLRAAAASVFMPIMQYHSEFNHHASPIRDRTPWNIAEQSGCQTVVDDFRRLIQLRERLVPYVATQAAQAVATDRPLMRALCFDWPRDQRIWQHPLEFMFGDDLLVHPVTQPGVTNWPTYLPSGAWVDAWTGQRLDGSHVIDCDVAGNTLVPVFCRADAWPQLAGIFSASDG